VIVALSVLLSAAVLAVAVVSGLSAARRSLEARIASTDAELRRIGDSTVWREDGAAQVRAEIAAFRSTLDQLRAREEERRAREDQSWAALHRVASVLAGGQRTGRAGENVLRDSLAHLPPSMVVTDFKVNGRVVEFGLILPDGRRLPIDSKWPAARELEALAECEDPDERDRLVRTIERTVLERAREVAQYRDPALTAPVGVAAVPDAAYALLRRAHAEAYRQGVIVVPYSMALPILLFLYTIAGRHGSLGDVEGCLADIGSALEAMEATLENRVARAATMLANGAEDLRAHIGKARSTLALARGGPSPNAAPSPTDLGRVDGVEVDEEEEEEGGLIRAVR